MTRISLISNMRKNLSQFFIMKLSFHSDLKNIAWETIQIAYFFPIFRNTGTWRKGCELSTNIILFFLWEKNTHSLKEIHRFTILSFICNEKLILNLKKNMSSVENHGNRISHQRKQKTMTPSLDIVMTWLNQFHCNKIKLSNLFIYSVFVNDL